MKLMNLKGTTDLLPKDQIVRNKIIDVLKCNFEKYGLLFGVPYKLLCLIILLKAST